MTGTFGAIIWLVIAIALFIIEGVTVQMLCIWFAFGALVAMLASFMGAPLILQLLLFFITSVAILIFGRPFVKKHITPKKTATNADAVIGQTGIVIEEIDNTLQTGRVSVAGLDWTARNDGEGVIGVREAVTIKRIDGVKVIVEPLKEREGVTL